MLDYTLGTEEHKCKKDALLGRIKHPQDKKWKLIRPRPTKNQYIGPYYICKGNLDVAHKPFAALSSLLHDIILLLSVI